MIAAIGAGVSLASSVLNMIRAQKQQQQVQKAHEEVMNSGVFNVPSAAIKQANQPIPSEVLRQIEQSMREAIGTGVGAMRSSRDLEGVGRLLEQQKEQNLGLAATGAQAQNQALQNLASHQANANQMKAGYLTGRETGAGELWKENKVMAYMGMSDMLKTLAASGLGGDMFGGGGTEEPFKMTINEEDFGGKVEAPNLLENPRGASSMGGFNFDMPSIFTQRNYFNQ